MLKLSSLFRRLSGRKKMNQGVYLICGYGGVGKSTLVERFKDQKFIDLDSALFSKSEKFPTNYLDMIRHLEQSEHVGSYVFISTHKQLLNLLQENNYYFALVCPDSTVSAEEWEQRYINRANPEGYIEFMREHYDEFVRDMEAHAGQNKQCLFVRLKEDEYLADKFGDIKQWFEKRKEES